MSSHPLADLRIVSVEQFGAGPWGSLQLAELGAEVIKIEDPSVGGDVARYIPPYQVDESSLFFETFNRGKRSLSLDLRQRGARDVLEDVVRESDAVLSNLRGDQPAKLGLRYSDLRRVKPTIVCCSLSGFGMTGPRLAEGAYDWTIQGLAGWQSVTGDPSGPPIKSGLSLVDYCGGYVAAIAILAGVWRARREERGAEIDLSLFEVALSQLAYLGTWVASHGYQPVRRPNSAHQSIVPFQNFETSDGWIVVACPKQSLWRQLCVSLDREDLVDDPRFATFDARDEHRDALLGILEPIFRQATTGVWLETLGAAGVPCAPVNDVADALLDPQVIARAALVDAMHPVLGAIRQLASPFRFDGAASTVRRGPFRGEDTVDVLRSVCGYPDEKIEDLIRAGVVMASPPPSEVTA